MRVSEAWKHATIAAAVRHAAGGSAAALVSGPVAALAEGASRVMIVHRFLEGTAALLLGRCRRGRCGAGDAGPVAAAGPAAAPSRRRGRRPLSRYIQGRRDGPGGRRLHGPDGPHTWWKPDGTPLAESPVDTIGSRLSERDWERARVILVRSSGMKKDDMFRWHPTRSDSYWGGRPTRKGQSIGSWTTTRPRSNPAAADCGVQVRVASGAWTTETSNCGGGGTGIFVNGHKFASARLAPIRRTDDR